MKWLDGLMALSGLTAAELAFLIVSFSSYQKITHPRAKQNITNMREKNIFFFDAEITWSKMSLQNVTVWGPSQNFSEIGPCSFRAQRLADPTKHRPTRADERATSGRRAGDEQATSFGHRGPGLDQAVYREQNRRRHIYIHTFCYICIYIYRERESNININCINR